MLSFYHHVMTNDINLIDVENLLLEDITLVISNILGLGSAGTTVVGIE